jgi:DNA (cytosine-5)-methyltransferase 1
MHSVQTASAPTRALDYLAAARLHHTQGFIASRLGVTVRTVRRWEARETEPPPYVVHALQQLLPFQMPLQSVGDFTFVDLFAGIGGMRLPFEEAGGRCVFTSEWDPYANRTYVENFGAHAIHGDITRIDADEIPDHDLLLAGFPCQPFSIAGVSKKNALGRKHGFADETQGTLFFDVARILERKRPRAFVLENVKNLLGHDRGRTFGVISRTLREELGYHVTHRVIDGANFVPQHRERIIIIGFREPVGFDWSILRLQGANRHTMREVLHRTDGNEPELPWDAGRFFDHRRRRPLDRYTLTPHLWRYLQEYKKRHRDRGNGFGFGLVGPDDVARTLSARYYKDGSEILVIQGARRPPRRLTPRECARLMGFPDTFRIPVSVSDTRAYQQFGNAVVVPLMREVARAIKPFLGEQVLVQPELPIPVA